MALTTATVIGAAASAGGAMMDNKNAKASLKSQERQKANSQKYIEEAVRKARSDIFKLYPAAQQARQQGLDAGISLFQQAYPQMQNSFQQGNVAAQKALIQGLGQQQNAFLGRPVDMSGMQAQALPMPQGLQLPPQQLQPINQLGLENG
jgi:hypothetical protein